MTALILTLVLLIAIAIALGVVLHYWGKVKEILVSIFGTSDIKQINEDGRRRASVTPKSLNSMTDLALPRLQADFPELNWHEFRIKSENILRCALMAISEQDMDYLDGVSGELREQARLAIQQDKLEGERNFYRDIKIHRTEIAGYSKRDGLCILQLQSAVGYTHWCERDGKTISGDKNYPTQTKYDIELIYVQDPDRADLGQFAIGVTCPNCGAPITSLGQKHCAYCDSAIEPINIRVWRYGKLRERK